MCPRRYYFILDLPEIDARLSKSESPAPSSWTEGENMKQTKHPFDGQSHYLLRESDLERIDSLIGALNLAISEIFCCRQIRERAEQDTRAVEDFTSQVELVLNEAELQLQLPGMGSSDF